MERQSTGLASEATAVEAAVGRRLLALVVLAGVLVAWPAPGRTDDSLMGAWTGSWSAPGAPRGGSVGLVLTPGTQPGRATGQFTFIHGAQSRTVRYEGTVADGVLRFALPTEGEIVLRREASGLAGEFSGRQTVVPSSAGTLTLSRSP